MSTRARTHTRSAVLALAAVLALSSCGGFAKKGSGEAVAPDDSSDVGGGVALPDQTTEAPTSTTPTTAPRSPEAPQEVRGPRGFANQTTRTDPSGFRVVLTLDGKLRYPASSDLKMQLDVDNVSKQTLRYDSNQTTYFQIQPTGGRSGPSWVNDQCDRKDQSGFKGPPVELEPGESITLNVATYPGERANRESCRNLTKGEYHLIGIVTWCTDDAMKDGICDPAKAKSVLSSPIRFVIE